jgi:hypothetical protein
MTFPLGLPVFAATAVSRERPMPAGARAVVAVGEPVRADQVVAEGAGVDGAPVRLLAGLAGRVARVVPGRSLTIEGTAGVIQGMLGLGGPAVGRLRILPRAEAAAVVELPRGALIVHPGQIPLTLLQRAAAEGVAGIVGAGIGARDLEGFLRADLTAVLDGLAPETHRLPLTLVLTEGVGRWVMDPRTFQELAQRNDEVAYLHGATDPRRGVRPEALVSATPGVAPQATPADDAIVRGARVRLAGGSERGWRGEVTHVFARRQRVEADLWVRAARVELEDGRQRIVPLAALERLR